MTRVLPADDEGSVRDAADRLRAGELVALPTETVYGLAARAYDEDAVLSVFAAKGRPGFDPLIVHVTRASRAELEEQGVLDGSRLSEAAARAVDALAALWPGPLTLVLPKGPSVPDAATSGLDTVAVRAPSHPTTRAVIGALGEPLVMPSANRFGRVSPTEAAHVADELGEAVALVLDAGATEHGVESTIVGIEDDGTARLLRPGALPRETIEEALGAPLGEPAHAGADGGEAPLAPGMLASHYAPRKTLRLLDAAEVDLAKDAPPPEGRPGVILYSNARRIALEARWAPAHTRVLSPEGDDREAARKLFAALRELDASDADWILAELPPEGDGLRPAIRDRLRRAAAAR